MIIRFLLLLLIAATNLRAQDSTFFREDWKEIAWALPVTQEHVANPALKLELHGPGLKGIKKSHGFRRRGHVQLLVQDSAATIELGQCGCPVPCLAKQTDQEAMTFFPEGVAFYQPPRGAQRRPRFG